MRRSLQVDRWLEDIHNHRRLAFDTNAVIYIVENVSPYAELTQYLVEFMERGVMAATISTVVEAEVLVKPLREGDHSILDRAGVFFNQTPNLLIRTCDRDIARRAALIRATTRLRLPDAIIVATALEEHSQVLIGNDAEIARRSVGIPYLYLENYIS